MSFWHTSVKKWELSIWHNVSSVVEKGTSASVCEREIHPCSMFTLSVLSGERGVRKEVMLALTECSSCVMELLMARNSTHSTDTADVSCIYRLPIIDRCQATDGGAQRFHNSAEKSLQILLSLRAPVDSHFKQCLKQTDIFNLVILSRFLAWVYAMVYFEFFFILIFGHCSTSTDSRKKEK